MFYIIIGIFLAVLGIWAGASSDYFRHFLCGMCLMCLGVFIAFFGIIITTNPTPTYYLEAEPLAYNYEANLTYFTSAEGQFKAEGIYPENTYLLTMDNNGTSDKEDDIVLVIWEPSKGEVG